MTNNVGNELADFLNLIGANRHTMPVLFMHPDFCWKGACFFLFPWVLLHFIFLMIVFFFNRSHHGLNWLALDQLP